MEAIERELISARIVVTKGIKTRMSQGVETETDTVRRLLQMKKMKDGPEAGTGLNRLTTQTLQNQLCPTMYLPQVLVRVEFQRRDHEDRFSNKGGARARARTVTIQPTPLFLAANLAVRPITTTTITIHNTMRSSKVDTHPEEASTRGSTTRTPRKILTRTNNHTQLKAQLRVYHTTNLLAEASPAALGVRLLRVARRRSTTRPRTIPTRCQFCPNYSRSTS